jgi:predicted GNAT superfamily acetyltransferase
MKHMVKSLKSIADPGLVIIAEDKGRPVGFGFGLPNYNEILVKMNGRLLPFGIFRFLLGRKKIKSMRMLVFGILKEYRASGISYLLAMEMVKQGMRKGYQWAELSWTLEDNDAVNKFAASLGGRIYKKYRIYEKKIG